MRTAITLIILIGLAMYASNGANAYFEYVLDKITINQ